MKARRGWPAQETWVMRGFRNRGEAFNPDAVCEYTGQALHMFPVEVGDCRPQLMGFWREDGELRGAYLATPEEKAWIEANPEAYKAEAVQFEAWLRQVRSTRKK